MLFSTVNSRKFIIFFVLCFFPLAWWSLMVANNTNFVAVWNEVALEASCDDQRQCPFSVSTPGCRILNIDPFDPIIKPLIQKVELDTIRKRCGKLPPLTLLTSDNRVVIDRDVFGLYGVNNVTQFQCRITAVLNDYAGILREGYRYSTEHRFFGSESGSVNVTEDHLRVQCFYNGTMIYKDFYATIQIRPELEARCSARFRETVSNGSDDDRLSVLILTLDSVSRVNVHRQMPRTAEYLANTMDAVEMFGYNKLGDNTFPILTTMLMGMSAVDVNKNCRSSGRLDKCPFIWKEFSRRGYRTAYGEDSIIISAFSALHPGFIDQPTDYCLRPTMLAEYESEKRTPWNQNDYYCFAKRVQVPVLMTFVRDFAAQMRDKPYFGYFHSSGLTHDDMNWAQLVDPMVHELLRESHESHYFNNTVFMLMSDHGARFGPIRNTYIGKLEETLPFVYLVFPPWFVRRHPSAMRNLRINAKRLMSSYDIYQTLQDILNARYDGKPPSATSSSSSSSSSSSPGLSLFNEIPETRTCSNAKIPEHYCACQTVEAVRIDTREATIASNSVVATVNAITRDQRELCAKYSLDQTLSIYSSKSSSAFLKDKTNLKAQLVTDYAVTVSVKPGGAKFEATVRFRGDESIGVLGDISRIDRYGTTSACVSDAILRKYCWCLHQLITATS